MNRAELVLKILDMMSVAAPGQESANKDDEAIDAEFKRVEDEPLLLEDHNKETTK